MCVSPTTDVKSADLKQESDISLAPTANVALPVDLDLIPEIWTSSECIAKVMTTEKIELVVNSHVQVSRFLGTKTRFGKSCIDHWLADQSKESYALSHTEDKTGKQLLSAAALTWASVKDDFGNLTQIPRLLLFCSDTKIRRGGFGSLLVGIISNLCYYRQISQLYVVALDKPHVINFWTSPKIGAKKVDESAGFLEQINPYNDTQVLVIHTQGTNGPKHLASPNVKIDPEFYKFAHMSSKDAKKKKEQNKKRKLRAMQRETMDHTNWLNLPAGNKFQEIAWSLQYEPLDRCLARLGKVKFVSSLEPASGEFLDLLCYAVRRPLESDTLELATLLVNKYNLNANRRDTCYQQNCLFWATHQNHAETTKFLLSQIEDINTPDIYGQNASFYSCRYGTLDVLREMVIAGTDIHARDNNHETPLMYAAHHGRLDIVKYLLAQGVSLEPKSLFEGLTAYKYAMKKNYLEVATLLKPRQLNN